ncbi:hypothetical protein [Caballeronia grimmiae]|uniref:Uncharacterized protein n=1 Tax=Caballeronia grimmiae TaxID=1071679 RepID=A0A069PEK0_9BURK|nr:hypothetical protein [Caballeronia grimmiae]KDR35741.1 hypothetical protein BG57_27795 [Caballeronia grimmiae]GGD82893.1 hypothetical protein GCM10010985_41690 [Caballeronia grimmiae]
MESDYEVLYKGCTLSPLAVEDGPFYTAMLIMRTADGEMRASGALGQFACALSARRYALAYGMADVDHREPPLPDWPPVQAKAVKAAHRARV